MKTVKIKLSDLKQGAISQQILPKGFIARVIKYKKILEEVENCSLEETISNFQRDLHPERELVVWENIACLYELSIKDNPKQSLSVKKEVFKEILLSTLM